jgi:hypothetical protein
MSPYGSHLQGVLGRGDELTIATSHANYLSP